MIDKNQTIATIARNIKRLREERGLTQKSIASLLGISFQQVQKYETGQNKIPIENLLILKRHYAVPFEEIFKGIDREIISDNCTFDTNIRRNLVGMAPAIAKQKLVKIVDIIAS